MTSETKASYQETLEKTKGTVQQINLLSELLEHDEKEDAWEECAALLQELHRVSLRRRTLPFQTVLFLQRLSAQKHQGEQAKKLRQGAEDILAAIGRIDVSNGIDKNEEAQLFEWLGDDLLGALAAEAITKLLDRKADASHIASVADYLCGIVVEGGFKNRKQRLHSLQALAALVDQCGIEVLTDSHVDELVALRSSWVRLLLGREFRELLETIVSQADTEECDDF